MLSNTEGATLSAPRVSVLMPVFNSVKHLTAALHSLREQTLTNYELIIVDDGSRDGSTALLESMAGTDPRMRLTVRHNLGVIATRNQLLQAARADLIAWMDSDDVSLPDRLALQVSAFDTDPELVCLGTAAQCIDPDGRPLYVERYHTTHSGIRSDQQMGGGMRFPTTMMRRRAAIATGGFREPFRIGEDFDFLLRLGELGKLGNLPDILYLYRQTTSSICATLGPQWETYRNVILDLARQRQGGRLDQLQAGNAIYISPPKAPSPTKRAHRAYTRWSRLALADGNWAVACRYSCAAIRARPLAMEGWKSAARLGRFLLSSLMPTR